MLHFLSASRMHFVVVLAVQHHPGATTKLSFVTGFSIICCCSNEPWQQCHRKATVLPPQKVPHATWTSRNNMMLHVTGGMPWMRVARRRNEPTVIKTHVIVMFVQSSIETEPREPPGDLNMQQKLDKICSNAMTNVDTGGVPDSARGSGCRGLSLCTAEHTFAVSNRQHHFEH